MLQVDHRASSLRRSAVLNASGYAWSPFRIQIKSPMALADEIANARKEVVTTGYDMSVGEVVNLYRNGELVINPEYQRLYRWDSTRKARLIETILLGLPLPPIFVYQRTDGIWELIDGLQRVATLLEFMGLLRDERNVALAPLRLEGTTFLPSLAEKCFDATREDGSDGVGIALQIQLKRARLRVEILQQESDPNIKFEVFQRLNTGGVNLSQQEVRNSVGYMIDPTFQEWLTGLADLPTFLAVVDQTDAARERQQHIELALRFLAFRIVPYQRGLDVHEYLDAALLEIAKLDLLRRDLESQNFQRTFELLFNAMGGNAFKRWDGNAFSGKFLMSVFEVVALGVSKNIDAIEAMPLNDRAAFVTAKCRDLWGNHDFIQNSGAGVRGTTRLANLLPLAEPFFHP